jgi:hypothetical protein
MSSAALQTPLMVQKLVPHAIRRGKRDCSNRQTVQSGRDQMK